MAKIAVAAVADKSGREVLARGRRVDGVRRRLPSGPDDRPFEERHSNFSIAVVAAGTFEYRSAAGRELMTPGSLMLGSAGQSFECGHEHGVGDRCVAFWYAPAYFERLAADAGSRGRRASARLRVPPLRDARPAGRARVRRPRRGRSASSWEELGVRLAAHAVQLSAGLALGRPARSAGRGGAGDARPSGGSSAEPDDALTLGTLARAARLSPYHFLRTFERITGVTPHQYVLRARLRQAAHAPGHGAGQGARPRPGERVRRPVELQPRLPRGIRDEPARLPAPGGLRNRKTSHGRHDGDAARGRGRARPQGRRARTHGLGLARQPPHVLVRRVPRPAPHGLSFAARHQRRPGGGGRGLRHPRAPRHGDPVLRPRGRDRAQGQHGHGLGHPAGRDPDDARGHRGHAQRIQPVEDGGPALPADLDRARSRGARSGVRAEARGSRGGSPRLRACSRRRTAGTAACRSRRTRACGWP